MGEEKKVTRRRKKPSGKLIINDFSWKEAKIAIALIVGALLFTSYGAYKYVTKNKGREVKEEDVIRYTTGFIRKDKRNEKIQITSYVLLANDLKEAENVLESFLSAQTAEQATPWIRKSGSMALFKDAYEPVGKVVRTKNISALKYQDDSRAAIFNVQTPQGNREIILFAEPDGEFKVDWQSALLTGSIPLKKYTQDVPPSVEDLYCYIITDYYYTTTFPEKDYQSIKLRDYTGEYNVDAYVKRGTYMEDILGDALLSTSIKLDGKKTARCVLSVKKGEGKFTSAEIIDIIATDWVTPLVEEEW